jgi:hypothetical protein
LKLPSCGWLYPELPDGKISISCLRGEDEELVAGAGEGLAALPVLRDKVKQLVSLGALPYEKLLFSDWIALLFNIFAFSYGSDMAFSPRCPSCKRPPPEPYVMDLEKLPCTVLDTDPEFKRDTFTEPFTTPQLPPWDDTVQWRFLRVEDQIQAEEYYEEGLAAGKPGDFMRTYSVARHITGINGEPVTLLLAMEWVKTATTGETLAALRNEFSLREPGYHTSVSLVCPLCSSPFIIHLPEDGSFFRRMDTKSRQSKAAKVLDAKLRAGGLSYLDWAAMTPWQRDDFCLRHNQFVKKRKKDLEKAKKDAQR